MNIETNIFKRSKSTRKLREIKEVAMTAIMDLPDKDKRLFIVEKQTIHFFSDCCFVSATFVIGKAVVKPDELSHKTLMVFSRDLKTWKEYKDQFEPAEGFHQAFEYKPHDSSFPTDSW